MKREIWKGSEAIAEAAIRAGCKGFFGYPITPQNEIPEYMSFRMEESGGVFVQAESEVAAINMVYGAAATGVRCMTSSSSPGISLKQEGISYMAGAMLPAVIVNVMRGGPGLGSIQPSQADYFQATRGGGNGDYRTPVLAPSNLQETVDLVQDAFDIADQYRIPVMLLADGLIGQMMEPIIWKEPKKRELPPKDWAASGRGKRAHNNFLSSLLIDAQDCENHNQKMLDIYKKIEENELRWEEIQLEDAEVVIVAYGTPARISITAAEQLRAKGIKAGVIRPITLWPFPYKQIRDAVSNDSVKQVLVVEMSTGQMLDDVKIAVGEQKPVHFYGRYGGVIPTVSEIAQAVERIVQEVK
ncbi:3-methyl-2-oxobutanoate dehydrogenase subunit VorB [uncultured Megasphaera sp.]|uniref:3-methyl-2-oxobutanoate dehydrogenase subunit VorB n=1 Tax=uncultured Megasphaera sp. TaxID=165188 RepID=UPI0025945B57|nr:3-methyl-2-oxobutanoate dehydrogenase subunit VorB [uncultured Megasphaera sp.]